MFGQRKILYHKLAEIQIWLGPGFQVEFLTGLGSVRNSSRPRYNGRPF
jgi:hypothetical protein